VGQTGSTHFGPAAVGRAMPPAIVIGFVGGFIRHDNLAHSEVQLAARLRQAYPLGVAVDTFESYPAGKARNRVLRLLDTNHDGTLTADEKAHAHIIIYGHSWGGSEAINLARELEKDGIPVLLTVQEDSISIYQNDRIIPANVARGQFLSAEWASPRPARDSRCRFDSHTHHRKFSVRLHSELLQLRTISLV
jgi:hypothetical protein